MKILQQLLRPNLTLTTKVSDLKKRQVQDIVSYTAIWCMDNMGTYNRRRNPFKISVLPDETDCYGQFISSENRLVIFYNMCPNIRTLIQTIIHEYTHYLQPIRENYEKLYRSFGYDNHPMEVEAREKELMYYKDAWKFVKTII
jgi:hypothetical protein